MVDFGIGECTSRSASGTCRASRFTQMAMETVQRPQGPGGMGFPSSLCARALRDPANWLREEAAR